MKKLSVLTYMKILVFIALAVVAMKFPNNDFDRVIADLLEIKVLALPAKIISLVFNDKLLLLIMILLTGFLVWIKSLRRLYLYFLVQALEDFSYQHLNIAYKELDHYQNFMMVLVFLVVTLLL